MGFHVLNSRFLASVGFACFIAAVAGCQSDDAGSVLDPGTGGGDKPPEGKILQSELRAYCPVVTLREGTAFHSTYEKKGEEDPTKLIYQSSISAVTRKCTYGAGTITMDVAVAGKVVPGPLAKDGTVVMPIRIAVMRGEEVLYSNVAKFEVTVSKGAGATQFIYNDPNVTFPTPEPRTVQVFAGYDDGPPKKGENVAEQ
jgi:hypothetical protein